ncbi:MAG: hypothetical protein AB7I59_16305 [Geminicoccaceae bacterium]
MTIPFSVPKLKAFPIRPRSALLARLLQSCAVIMAINWCLQGMRGMDRKELAFRLLLEGLAGLVIALGLSFRLSAPAALSVAFFAAHSLGFTFNGQAWVCARYCRWYRRDPALLETHLQRVTDRLRRLPWLREAVCIGSLGRKGAISGDRADLDLRLVFPSGFAAWLRVNLLLLRLRAEAFLRRIPLDLYAYDRPERLRRFDQREPLVVLLDRDGRLSRLYPRRAMAWP